MFISGHEFSRANTPEVLFYRSMKAFPQPGQVQDWSRSRNDVLLLIEVIQRAEPA